MPNPQKRRANKVKHDSLWFGDYGNQFNTKTQHIQGRGNEPMIKDCEAFSTAENVDTEEDQITDCLNEEVESYFSFPSQRNISSTSLHGNRWENYYLPLIFCNHGKNL